MHAITLSNALAVLTRETDPTRAPRLLAELCLNAQPQDVTPESQRFVQWHLAELAAGIEPSAAIPEARTTPLAVLWHDGAGYNDRAFAKWVNETIASRVTSPVSHDDLAQADPEEDCEPTWTLEPGTRYEARVVYALDAHGDDSLMVAVADHVGEALLALDVPRLATNWGLWDTDCGEWVDDFSEINTPDMELQTHNGDTLDVYCTESEADEQAETLNTLDANENAHGIPWAQYNSYQLRWGRSEPLALAGFAVATHNPSGETYFGIDGGGYCFDTHWVRLALLLAGADGVPTDSGQRVYVTGYTA